MLKNLQVFEGPEGNLVPIEFDKLPFIPQRVFYVANVPKGEIRGGHAHYNTKQVLICVKGEINVELRNSEFTMCYNLKPNQQVFVDSMIWDSQKFMTGDDVLLSICSTKYDKKDYIEDFNKFIAIVNTQNNESGEGI